MASIKVNINSKVSPIRTSTTFTEVFARFFLNSCRLMNPDRDNINHDWLMRSETDSGYKNRKEVGTAFQLMLNELLDFYDNIYGIDYISANRWTRENIEFHLLRVIALAAEDSSLESIQDASINNSSNSG